MLLDVQLWKSLGHCLVSSVFIFIEGERQLCNDLKPLSRDPTLFIFVYTRYELSALFSLFAKEKRKQKALVS